MAICKIIRFDVSQLSIEQLNEFDKRAELVAFMTQYGAPQGKTLFIDVFFETEPDLPKMLNGFDNIRYIDYTSIPYKDWKYPF